MWNLFRKSNKPLIKKTNQRTSEADDVSEIIKPIESEVNTPSATNKTKIVTESDKISNEEFIARYLTTPLTNTNDKLAALTNLTPGEISQLKIQDQRLRDLEDQRQADFDEAIADETKRRDLHDRELAVKQTEKNLYMKEKYPDFVGQRFIKDGQESVVRANNEREKLAIKTERNVLTKRKVARLEREKARKQIESTLSVNNIIQRQESTFFEEDVLTDRREKLELNPEIENLNSAQKLIREAQNFEIASGKSIVSHRDIMESEESDFDTNRITRPNDILIATERQEELEAEMEKCKQLMALKKSLENNNSEPDFKSRSKFETQLSTGELSPESPAALRTRLVQGAALVN